jgi:hypothetical protein
MLWKDKYFIHEAAYDDPHKANDTPTF